jgi:hypothetical protein
MMYKNYNREGSGECGVEPVEDASTEATQEVEKYT